MAIAIRAATSDDHAAILALVPRLAATGTPALRDQDQVRTADIASVGEALALQDGRSAFFVAEVDGGVAGFIHVRRVLDYYTQREITHVSDVVVATDAEGRGVGRALMTAGETWAKQHGHALIQLYVLPENTTARTLYERSGYTPEWLKYIKPIE